MHRIHAVGVFIPVILLHSVSASQLTLQVRVRCFEEWHFFVLHFARIFSLRIKEGEFNSVGFDSFQGNRRRGQRLRQELFDGRGRYSCADCGGS